MKGRNSRLDELQAAVLRVKLKYLDCDNAARRRIAMRYVSEICNPELLLPSPDFCDNSVHHIFPVLCRRRDELQRYLADGGVQTVIHYPIPPHRQLCYTEFGGLSLPVTERIHREELSIPLNQTMQEEEVDKVISLLDGFN